MRVTCKTELPSLSTTHQAFDTLAKIYFEANSRSNTKMTFNLEKASHGDANISAVCASIGFVLGKSQNSLDIGPRKHGYNKVKLAKDMFGYRCSYAFQRFTFHSNGSEVKVIEPNRELEFRSYLIEDAIRPDWRKFIPVHYWVDVKDFLLKLYRNCSDHSNTDDPIFISSSFKNNVLTFTIADCGSGFLKQVRNVRDGIASEAQAIAWAMNGSSVKGDDYSRTLKELGDYCWFNEGSLLVVSGNSSVEYKENGVHEVQKLTSPIRGAVINFSIKIEKSELIDSEDEMAQFIDSSSASILKAA